MVKSFLPSFLMKFYLILILVSEIFTKIYLLSQNFILQNKYYLYFRNIIIILNHFYIYINFNFMLDFMNLSTSC
jgi:hypothetical protein